MCHFITVVGSDNAFDNDRAGHISVKSVSALNVILCHTAGEMQAFKQDFPV